MSWWHPKPKPPSPAPPARLEVHLSVWGHDRLIADQVTMATLVPEPTGAVVLGHLAALENRIYFTLPAGTPYTWGAQLALDAPGYQPFRERVFLAQDLNKAMQPAASPVAALERLVADGQFFRLAGGDRFTAIECSDFLLYQRFLNGEDLTAVLTQRRDLGFNMVRVFGMYNGSLGHFIPAEYGERYFTELPAFYALLARYGLYGEFTANADSRTVFQNAAQQLAVWMRLGTIFPGITSSLVECVNENDQTINALWADLPRMLNVLCSHGSNGSQALPVRPWWDYETFHTNGAPGWWRKGHNGMELSVGADGVVASHVPCLVDEQTRPDADRNIEHFREAGAVEALLTAGGCFHSISGKASVLFSGIDLEAAIAFVAGARSVPVSCQPGDYRLLNRGEPNAGERRVYNRGGVPACTVTTSRE